MMEHYNKKPTVKFLVNKDKFNKLMEILSFQEENIVSQDWVETIEELKDTIFRYSIPKKDKDNNIAIIDIALYPKEASDLISLLISAFENLKVDKDYTQYMKRV